MRRIVFLFVLVNQLLISQTKELTTSDLKEHTTYFNISDGLELPEKVRTILKKDFNQAQFVGLAEVHQSQHLSYFTSALLKLLSESCYDNFILEIGPYAVEKLSEFSKYPDRITDSIRLYNRKYGKNTLEMTPFMFADKIEEADFLAEASKLGFKFWGIDQEYSMSFEMHIDILYSKLDNKTPKIKSLYKGAKRIIRNSIFKRKFDSDIRDCAWLNNNVLNSFFDEISVSENIKNHIEAIKKSWDIYCKAKSGVKGSSQERANLMKLNFDKIYSQASANSKKPKFFLKMGQVHLTHNISPFGIDDIGKYINVKADKNGSKFISIYHLRRFKDGKDIIERKDMENVKMALNLGKKDKWTLIDLRPIKIKIKSGQLKTENAAIKYGLDAYDYMLISPDDTNGKLNY